MKPSFGQAHRNRSGTLPKAREIQLSASPSIPLSDPLLLSVTSKRRFVIKRVVDPKADDLSGDEDDRDEDADHRVDKDGEFNVQPSR